MFGRNKVTMVVSVGDWAAGKTYRLPRLRADSFILRGYATGKLSKEYSEDEISDMKANRQVVRI